MSINIRKIQSRQAIAISAIALVLVFFAPIFYFIYIPVYNGNAPIEVLIEDGESLRGIARTLKENNLIRSEFAFIVYVKMNGDGNNLKAGRYNFAGRLDVPGIAYILANGLSRSEDIRLLVSEGFNVWEIDERLVSLRLIKEGQFSSVFHNEEGYLFPDTYRINRKSEGPEFVLELRERMRDNFNKKTGELLKGLSLSELREVITIASILEKEARSERDMRLVSGIIKNRLGLGMPLQVDATVIYGACLRKSQENGFTKNCDVTFQGPAIEIKIDGPFNSYTRKGLPPAPIANPGVRAIQSALNPQGSDYLYYLSTRDGSQMIYSKTAGEHVANRRKYLGI